MPKPILVYDSPRYRITRIPLNWAVDIKIMVDGKRVGKKQKLLTQTIYVDVGQDLKKVHETAEYMIKKYSR